MAACTATSGEKSGPTNGRASSTTRPRATPASTPQRNISWVAARVRSTCPAPRALPVIACAAMAIASREKVRKDQIVAVTW